jgi:hypothetical protein
METIMDECNFLIQLSMAVGTIAVAVMAIWGDYIRSKLAPPKLIIQPHNLRGTVTRFTGGPRVIYYHLKLVNLRPWLTAKNCRVLLRAIHRRGPNHQFGQIPLPVPPQYVWAPAGFTPAVTEITKDQILDFGSLIEGETLFKPVLYFYPNDFQGFIEAHEAVRYSLEIIAQGYTAKRYQVFEVAWDGTWSDNLDQMSQSLTIREVSGEDAY